MAAADIKAGAGSSLPSDVADEVRADWATDPVKTGKQASEVRMPFEDLKTFRSNRAFDCLEVARAAVAAAKIKPPTAGMVIGTKTWREGNEDAVDEVLAADGTVATPGKPEVLGVLVVQTFWKVKS